MIAEKIKQIYSIYRYIASVCMWVLLIKKLLSTAIEKLWNLPCTDQIDRCRRVIRGFFVCRDRYEKNGKLIGWKTRFWNRQFSDKVCSQSNCCLPGRCRWITQRWKPAHHYLKKMLHKKRRRTFTDESSIKEDNIH